MLSPRPTPIGRRTLTTAILLVLSTFVLTFAGPGPAGAAISCACGGGGEGGGGGGGETPPPPINQPPVANLSSSTDVAIVAPGRVLENAGGATTPPVPGTEVTFDASASSDDHGIARYEWDLDGNGSYETSSADAKVEKTLFYQRGSITVHLRVTDTDGATSVATKTITVHVAPTASVRPDQSLVQVGQTVTFDAQRSFGDPAIATYEWDLDGDGKYELETTTPKATTAFKTSGRHSIGLLVTDTLGGTRTTSADVMVNRAPTAAFTMPGTAVTGQAVKLDASSSTDDDPIADYAWDLDGNGSFETDTFGSPAGTAIYATPGVRTIALRVIDSHGVQSTIAHSLVVVAPGSTSNGGGGANDSGGAAKIAIASRSARVARTGAVTIRIACAGARDCSGRLTLARGSGAHRVSLGGANYRIAAGQTAGVRLVVSKTGRTLVKRLHSVAVQATATATGVATSRASLKLMA